MRTKEILENQKHGFNSGQKEAALKAMQQYADEFACAFAEWKSLNTQYVGINNGGNKIYCIDSTDNVYTINQLLEIYKQQINGKV